MNQSFASVSRVAAINDISGFGRCSLTVAIPILSAMGIQCCPLPTAVLSQHTGFEHFYFNDLTPQMSAYIESWKLQGLRFDTVYSGFLGSEEQIRLVDGFITAQKENALIFVDPVMGDGGKVYPTYTSQMCDGMRELVHKANIITPNITEACLLTGTPYPGEAPGIAAAKEMAVKLAELGPAYSVITGICRGNQITSLAYDGNEKNFFTCSVERTDVPYLGTGDIFASVLCGCMTKGQSLRSALQNACDFVRDTTQYTKKLGSPIMDGVAFEPLLFHLGGNMDA
ncbi:MAG TPA: pyridoxamine kinase [Clostridia bacterium]|nr:pyridoxamine kinase [Clostridia bacterium]